MPREAPIASSNRPAMRDANASPIKVTMGKPIRIASLAIVPEL